MQRIINSPMTIPTKKLKNGFEIPEYGLGTWRMGGWFFRNFLNNDDADIEAIQTAIELGVTHIDTAEIYANGHAEELIAKALRRKNIDRQKLFIVSKVEGGHHSYKGVIDSCKASLKRLNTDYLDLYLLHEYANDFPLRETARALSDLKNEGLIKHIGVSNFGVRHLKEIQEYCKYPIVCDQVHYNLKVREIESAGLLKFCQENDIMIVAYRPTEKSKLFNHAPAVLTEMCKKYNKTLPQIAINWLISQPNVATIAKTSDINHLKENLGALGWRMRPEDIEKLRADYPDKVNVSDIMPLG